MTYSIVYSSRTGNTALLAEQLRTLIPEGRLLYFGPPDPAALEADFIFVGFWTDKGTGDSLASDFLKTLRGKQLFLFGTAGFGGAQDYYTQILSRVQADLDSSNTVAGTYMCQGKMPPAVRKRYESMQAQQPEKAQEQLANFDRALSHPDKDDLANLLLAAKPFIQS